MEFKDYYKILGVERAADEKAISRAFRKLARQHHPDVNKQKGAEERFKEINEAHQVLSDPKKRAQYDQIFDAYKSGAPWQDVFGRAAGGAQGWPGGWTVTYGDAEDLEGIFGGRGGGLGGFSDFFEQLFGRAARAPGRGATATQPRAQLEVNAQVTLAEAFHGARRQVQLPSGKRVDVEIPKGVRSGQTMRLAGAADGQDVYITVDVASHPLLERSGDDLTLEVPVTPAEAALGAEIKVPTFDGPITVTIPAGMPGGQRLRLKGLGMPRARGGGRGDLYVRIRLVLPGSPTTRERELYEELKKAQAKDPRSDLRL
jgi:DnaJ-class molecular chaperone